MREEDVADEVAGEEGSLDFRYFTAHFPCLRGTPDTQKVGIQVEVFEIGPPSIVEVALKGAVAEYNARCVLAQNPEDAICQGDQLLEVNGAVWDSEISSLLSNLRRDEILFMVLRRKKPSDHITAEHSAHMHS